MELFFFFFLSWNKHTFFQLISSDGLIVSSQRENRHPQKVNIYKATGAVLFFFLVALQFIHNIKLRVRKTLNSVCFLMVNRSAALHRGLAAGPPETVRKLLAGSVTCPVGYQTALQIFGRGGHVPSGVSVWQQHPHSCYNESEEPLFRLLINTLGLFLFPSKAENILWYKSLQQGVFDILRWEHASFELPQNSTWWVENLPPLPRQDVTKQNRKWLKEYQLHHINTTTNLYLMCKHLANL